MRTGRSDHPRRSWLSSHRCPRRRTARRAIRRRPSKPNRSCPYRNQNRSRKPGRTPIPHPDQRRFRTHKPQHPNPTPQRRRARRRNPSNRTRRSTRASRCPSDRYRFLNPTSQRGRTLHQNRHRCLTHPQRRPSRTLRHPRATSRNRSRSCQHHGPSRGRNHDWRSINPGPDPPRRRSAHLPRAKHRRQLRRAAPQQRPAEKSCAPGNVPCCATWNTTSGIRGRP